MDDVYERLADALDRLANGFPRTSDGVEIRLLQKMFTREEAAVAAALSATPQTSAMVAERAGAEEGRARALLKSLVGRGLVWLATTPGWRGYRLAPFVVGSYEAHMLATRDPEYAALVEQYLTAGGAVALMAPQPAMHRTVPARAAVKDEWVLPYDDVRQLLLGAEAFRLGDCVCRVQQDQLGRRRCDFPVESCLWFSSGEPSAAQGTITRAEALAFLDRAEQIGLVHTVSNVSEGAGYVCNCCGCCCGLLRGITEWGIEHSVAQANYFAEIDADACSNCGTCVDRCQVHAISEGDAAPMVDLARCIGCGLCVTGCDQDAAHLQRKPQDETVVPPIDFAAWERERLRSRGLL